MARDGRYLRGAGAVYNGMPRMAGILEAQEQFIMVCPGMTGILEAQEQFIMVCLSFGDHYSWAIAKRRGSA